MDDVRRQDRRLFIRELLSPARVFVTTVAVLALLGPFGALSQWSWGWNWYLAMLGLIGIVHAGSAYNASLGKRFLQKRYEALWNGCVERLRLFDEVLAKMQRDRVADLQEMPKTIRRVGAQLYTALRRADMISHEVQLTERGLYHQPPAWSAPTHDAQATELYRLADKNIAEYRMQFAGVMAGVQRTEGQCAVFMTTVDSLRMKMIGYRLVGRQPELSSHDFLEALAEARLQLSAIDKALDELDLGVFPKTISVVSPGNPIEAPEPSPDFEALAKDMESRSQETGPPAFVRPPETEPTPPPVGPPPIPADVLRRPESRP